MASIDGIAVFGSRGDGGENIPMLHQLSILDTEQINPDIPIFADQTGPMSVDRDEIAIGKHAPNVAFGMGEGGQEAIDEGAQTFDAVFTACAMLDVGIADIASDRAVDITVEMGLFIKGQNDPLIALRSAFNCHWNFHSVIFRRTSKTAPMKVRLLRVSSRPK